MKAAIKTYDSTKEVYIGGVDAQNLTDDVRAHLHKLCVCDADIEIWPGNNVHVEYSIEKVKVYTRHSFKVMSWPQCTQPSLKTNSCNEYCSSW